jgi:hypothetical protein
MLFAFARRHRPALVAALLTATSGCIGPIGQARRARLSDPMMSLSGDPTETFANQKLHTSREGAAGGDGAAAGGGCACQ